MIGRFLRSPEPGFDLTAHVKRVERDPCFFMHVEPQDQELEARVKLNLRKGDPRVWFARLVVGGRCG